MTFMPHKPSMQPFHEFWSIEFLPCIGPSFSKQTHSQCDPTQNHFEMVCTSPMACIKSSTSTYEQKIQKKKKEMKVHFLLALRIMV
jgi:hypothetical protein